MAVILLMVIASSMVGLFGRASTRLEKSRRKIIALALAQEAIENNFAWPVVAAPGDQATIYPNFTREIVVSGPGLILNEFADADLTTHLAGSPVTYNNLQGIEVIIRFRTQEILRVQTYKAIF